MTDYSEIDQPLLLGYLFYPRQDFTPCPDGAFDLPIQVGQDVSIVCRFHGVRKDWPWILFFHGNGEVVGDYDDIALLYQKKGINLVVADYRGYGASTGNPTISYLIQDAHSLLAAVKKELARKGFRQDVWVMGRSLGSISAWELGSTHPDQIKGLVIESGFASVTRLIQLLRLPARAIALEPIEKERWTAIRKMALPVLIIHGARDHLIPLEEAQDLWVNLPAGKKDLVIIPRSDHNNILQVNSEFYLETIRKFITATQ